MNHPAPSGMPAVPDAAIVFDAVAADWRAAVRAAGDALVASGATRPDFTTSMVEMVERHGPYIVIAPGLALAHARPSAAVLREGVSVVRLASPVRFGHPNNDPVRVVIGLALPSADRHVAVVAALANAFNDSDAAGLLAAAGDADAVRAVLGASAGAASVGSADSTPADAAHEDGAA